MTDQKASTTEQDLKKVLALSIGTKSIVLSYVLWFFLGALGIHRMYLGKVASGVVMAILTIFGWMTLAVAIGIIPLIIVLVWWICDFFMIYFAAKKHNAIHNSLIS